MNNDEMTPNGGFIPIVKKSNVKKYQPTAKPHINILSIATIMNRKN